MIVQTKCQQESKIETDFLNYCKILGLLLLTTYLGSQITKKESQSIQNKWHGKCHL